MAVVMTSNPMFEMMPFSFWVDAVADSIAEMMIEQAVEEMEAEPMPEPEPKPIKAEPVMITTSLFELINNLPEDCSHLIYKCVMNDCIKQIPQKAYEFYEVAEQRHIEQRQTYERKIDGLERRYKKCKNKAASDEKMCAYLDGISISLRKMDNAQHRMFDCPARPIQQVNWLDAMRD